MSAKFYKDHLRRARLNIEHLMRSNGKRFETWHDISNIDDKDLQYLWTQIKHIRDDLLMREKELPPMHWKSEVIIDALANAQVGAEYQDVYSKLSRTLRDLADGDLEIYGLIMVSYKFLLGEPILMTEAAGLTVEQQILGLEYALQELKSRGKN